MADHVPLQWSEKVHFEPTVEQARLRIHDVPLNIPHVHHGLDLGKGRRGGANHLDPCLLDKGINHMLLHIVTVGTSVSAEDDRSLIGCRLPLPREKDGEDRTQSQDPRRSSPFQK